MAAMRGAVANNTPLLCNECRRPATDFCCCDYPPTFLCGDCVQGHRDMWLDDVHALFPTDELWRVENQQDCVRAQCKTVNYKAAEGRLWKSLSALDQCEADLTQAFDFAVACLQHAKETRLRDLAELKASLCATIKSSLDAVKVHILDKTFVPQNDIIREINDFDHVSDPAGLEVFRYAVSEEKIRSFPWEEALGIAWNVGCGGSGGTPRKCERCRKVLEGAGRICEQGCRGNNG